eukprot:14681-Heterococcus_DN1.PRE.1
MSSSGDQVRAEQGHSAAISRDPAPLASELSLLHFGRHFAHHRCSFRACASSVLAAVAFVGWIKVSWARIQGEHILIRTIAMSLSEHEV